MQECPHCGSRVDGEPSCPNCGQSFEALSEPTRDDPPDATEPPAQSDPPVEAPTESADETRSETEADSPLLSRRALLGGAGASVALLGASGVGWVFLRGGGEGRRVIKSYVDAMAANDFGRVPELFHEDASVLAQIERSNEFDDYEGYLEQRGVLDTWRELEPELNGVEELYHITEVTEESLSELPVRIEPSAVGSVDEFRQIVAFITVRVGAVNPDEETTAKYYDNETQQLPLTCSVVRSSDGWQLWTARPTIVA